MPQTRGRNVSLSPARRVVCELLHFGARVPTMSIQRRFALGDVEDVRGSAQPCPSWAALLLKAYAFVAKSYPLLRCAYLGYPRPRLYEHADNVAVVALDGHCGDEAVVQFANLPRPETLSLGEIDTFLQATRREPNNTLARNLTRLVRLPRPLRRLLAWPILNVAGGLRARLLGTFGLNVYEGIGATSLHPLSVVPTTLNYKVSDGGRLEVRLLYDQRVADAPTMDRILDELERTLRQEILTELRYYQALAA